MLEPGDIFEERYRILEQVGEGGFARVYRASQLGAERDVALKLMSAIEETADEDRARIAAGRFEREIRSMARLRSPYTVTLYDFGVTRSGQRYMVSEFIDGPSLQEVIAARGALPPAEALRYLCQLCLSLKEAHAQDILHRDIKPGNIMLQQMVGVGTQAKLLDFGIAKTMASKSTRDDITADATLLGTIRYMSPEQLRNKPLAPTSDIYSLGLVLWEMLLGKRWTDEDDNIALITMHLEGAELRLPSPSPLPPPLERLLRRMIATDRADRLQSADAVLALAQSVELPDGAQVALPALLDPSISEERLLPAILDPSLIELLPVEPAGPATPFVELIELDELDEWEERAATRRPRWALLALPLALLVGVGGALTLKYAGAPSEAPAQRDAAAAPSAAPSAAALPAPAPPRVYSVAVETTPGGLEVLVNGASRGVGPLTLELGVEDFPVELVASAGGQPARHVIEAPRDEQVTLEPAPAAPKQTERKPRRDAQRKPTRAKIVAIDEL
jgi:eukaryotic-like serine/threonine-protein kinase